MATATFADFNNDSRALDAQLIINTGTGTIVVTRDNYLIDMQILEETGTPAEGNLLGYPSANELVFTLYNENRMFTLDNPASPLYGIDMKGKVVTAHLICNGKDPIVFNDFRIDEWKQNRLTVAITCYDKLSTVFNSKDSSQGPAKRNVVTSEAVSDLFTSLGYTLLFASSTFFIDYLPYWYPLDSARKTLESLSDIMPFAWITSNRAGNIVYTYLPLNSVAVDTLTDDNQIYSISDSSTLNSKYTNAFVTMYNHTATPCTKVLTVSDIELEAAATQTIDMKYMEAPTLSIDSVFINNTNITLTDMHFYANSCHIVATNASANTAVSDGEIQLYGTSISASGDTTTLTDCISIDSRYVQTADAKDKLTNVLNLSLGNKTPFLELAIRGNPLLKLGDKIRVNSDKFKINFTGFIVKQQFTYNGGLTSNITLIDSNRVEEASGGVV